MHAGVGYKIMGLDKNKCNTREQKYKIYLISALFYSINILPLNTVFDPSKIIINKETVYTVCLILGYTIEQGIIWLIRVRSLKYKFSLTSIHFVRIINFKWCVFIFICVVYSFSLSRIHVITFTLRVETTKVSSHTMNIEISKIILQSVHQGNRDRAERIYLCQNWKRVWAKSCLPTGAAVFCKTAAGTHCTAARDTARVVLRYAPICAQSKRVKNDDWLEMAFFVTKSEWLSCWELRVRESVNECVW